MAEIGLRANAARRHLPSWDGRLTPHVLRHFCASQLYLNGMDLLAIRETLGHAWVATTMNYMSATISSGRGRRLSSAPGPCCPVR